LGSSLSALTAASQAAALRDVMYTFAAPAWRNLRAALEAGVVTQGKELTRTPREVQGLLNLPLRQLPFP
jgi:hypothetical protein